MSNIDLLWKNISALPTWAERDKQARYVFNTYGLDFGKECDSFIKKHHKERQLGAEYYVPREDNGTET
jgi:hypothetical protein